MRGKTANSFCSKEFNLILLFISLFRSQGMTLDIDPNLQYSLLDYVAHLTSNDYDKLPEDLVALGFLKEDKLDFAKRSGALEPLKYFLRQAGEGGGARGVRERIFAEYREKYPGLSDDELRIEMRSEMKAQVREIAEREGAVTGLTVEVEELQRRNRYAQLMSVEFCEIFASFCSQKDMILLPGIPSAFRNGFFTHLELSSRSRV